MKSTDKLLREMLRLARENAKQPEGIALHESVPAGFVTRIEARLGWPVHANEDNVAPQEAGATSANFPELTSIAS